MSKRRDMLKSVIGGDMAEFKTAFKNEVDTRVGQAASEVKNVVQAEFGGGRADEPDNSGGAE